MDHRLLEKFFEGECSEPEVEKVLSWINKQNHSEEVEALFQKVWSNLKEKNRLTLNDSLQLKHAIFDQIKKHDLLEGKSEISRQGVAKKIPFIQTLKIAAIIFLVGAMSVVLTTIFTEEDIRKPVVSETVTNENPAGIKKSYRLHDSSRVFLNSASKISYPNQFSLDKREISLEGEAYFEVKKDVEKPFVVVTENLKTTALGTAFNICSYRDNQRIVISLTKGKIKVENLSIPGEQFFLRPGEQLVYFKSTGETHKKVFHEEKVIAWIEGTIHFKNASLQDIIKKLERWYGVRFEIIQGQLEQGDNWNYSGTFSRESLDNVLEGIGYVKEFDFKIKDKIVQLKLK